MTTLRIVLGDQCSDTLSALEGLDPARDVVLMAEVRAECTYVRHHKQKIVLVLSAMRHFAERLRVQGVSVKYTRLDDPANTGSLASEVSRLAERLKPGRIVCTHPGEWRVLQDMQGWEAATGIPVEIRGDTRFLCSLERFRRWAGPRKVLRMEFFYREMRRETGLLMEAPDQPAGGQWNFDHDNRKPLDSAIRPPKPLGFPPDAITREVMALVAREFPDHFGTLDAFAWPVTRDDALLALGDFVTNRLPRFGDHQDAMAEDEPTMFHGLVAPAMNVGLLLPGEVCAAAERAWREGDAPLNGVEGFVRQILGWREYVRGVYWTRMPEYRDTNALEATRKLPWFWWSGETPMACIAAVVRQTRDLAYAHHIQRLMVMGNFALIAGLDPREVNEWFMVVYADAFEWVELPNTHGMALFADGGVMASKPYAASGAYISRMSDHCRGCAYDVKQSTGPRACPFNHLYWDFVARNAERLAKNPRMGMPLRTLSRMDQKKLAAMRAQSRDFLAALDRGETPSPAPASSARRTVPAMSLPLPEPSPAPRRRQPHPA